MRKNVIFLLIGLCLVAGVFIYVFFFAGCGTGVPETTTTTSTVAATTSTTLPATTTSTTANTTTSTSTVPGTTTSTTTPVTTTSTITTTTATPTTTTTTTTSTSTSTTTSTTTTTLEPVTSFSVETVDGIGNTGRYPSIAVEGTDTIHIGYMDWTNGMLKYALRESGSSWSTEEVDNVGTVNLIDTSLGVDSNSKVHISHYSQSDGIYYSTNVGGGWQQTFVGDMGSSRLAVDNQDNIHLGLTNNKDDTITISYATNKSGGWVTTTIATWDAALEGGACAIAVAGSNEVHMVYCDGTSLTYSQISDGGASSEEAQSVNEVRYNPGMALDSNNKPHLVYFDDGYIKYTNRVSDDWLIPANIFTPEDGGMAPAMAIDSNDKIHVCFSTAGDAGGGTDIKYATNREGDWGYATVATMVTGEGLDFSNPDLLPSIAVDSNNQAHISFYDLDNQDLKYAVEE